jgi:uncharacterized protein
MDIFLKIATELKITIDQVKAAIELFDGGATVPFISRYRKEATGGLNDSQLRILEGRLHYLRELEERRHTILKSIREQDKLTPDLEKSILAADNKATLEDLYLPYKPKRRTKAQIAREAGLEALAFKLLDDPSQFPAQVAEQFINLEKAITTVAEALEGARQILIEHFAEEAALLGKLRSYIAEHGVIKSEVLKGKEESGNKFADYFAYQEPLKKMPSHRALALFRGQQEQILRLSLILEQAEEAECQGMIAQQFAVQDKKRPADAWLSETVALAWNAKLFLKLSIELMVTLQERAGEEAITVFSSNLKNLLMAAPAGSRVTLGLDPGIRTGVKVVVVNDTGKLMAHTVIFPHAPRNEWDASLAVLEKLCKQFQVELVSIGNGTASRETDKLVADLKKRYPDLKLTSVIVSEAGASVYSASALAAKEFPELDVSYRGAVSIARRLQDPLAELVKIEPKAIGVGQYQHDVNQVKLSRALQAVMEDCVNAVGVDVNMASIPLLSCVAGLNEAVAKNIIDFRDKNGSFKNRAQLKKVPRLGEKAFEQAAGFLRIIKGENPLDASAVHPESYSVVERILAQEHKSLPEVMGNTAFIRSLQATRFTDEKFGLPTVTDILHELEKPGRDPRPEFKTATFKEGIEKINDLRVGMILEGVVTNVANFGAFVDIGVHHDGLVHISVLADRFIKDPHEVVKVGNIVKVKVIEVDLVRKRIQLSMRLGETAVNTKPPAPTTKNAKSKTTQISPQMTTALGEALFKALKDK